MIRLSELAATGCPWFGVPIVIDDDVPPDELIPEVWDAGLRDYRRRGESELSVHRFRCSRATREALKAALRARAGGWVEDALAGGA